MLAYYVHHLNKYLIYFGNGWGVRYYGLSYAIGFIFFFWGLHYQARRGWLSLTKTQIEDFVLWVCLLGVFVGGRLGYCLFYDLSKTIHDPLSVFRTWDGGMSSHGGILGVIGVMWWYANRKGIAFYHLADAAAWCTPVGLGLGRIANFINGELWGRPSHVPWAVIFPDADSQPRHPSQLYEASLEGVILFAILYVVRIRTRSEGVVALTFLGAYASLRIIGECFREPDIQIGYFVGGMTQGQLLSIGLLVTTAILEFRRRQTRRRI